MGAALILDAHIDPRVASALRRQGFDVLGLPEWRGGEFRTQVDLRILRQARAEGRVLVTFDVSTIPDLLVELALAGEDHRGVILISSKTFRQDDVRGLTRALSRTLTQRLPRDTTNFCAFLSP